jgi:ABC-type nitrate/sulfonate/bicarbonate transport system substrate-binding protein
VRSKKLSLIGTIAFLVVALPILRSPAYAETVKVGIVRATIVGDLRIAVERGYFAREGLSVEIVNFDSAQPVAVVAASGDIDFGSDNEHLVRLYPSFR